MTVIIRSAGEELKISPAVPAHMYQKLRTIGGLPITIDTHGVKGVLRGKGRSNQDGFVVQYICLDRGCLGKEGKVEEKMVPVVVWGHILDIGI